MSNSPTFSQGALKAKSPLRMLNQTHMLSLLLGTSSLKRW